MNDYKELIERLRDLKKAMLNSWTIERLQAVMRMDCLDAADAIEQLVKERDSYKKDYKLACKELNEFIEAAQSRLGEWRGVQE